MPSGTGGPTFAARVDAAVLAASPRAEVLPSYDGMYHIARKKIPVAGADGKTVAGDSPTWPSMRRIGLQ